MVKMGAPGNAEQLVGSDYEQMLQILLYDYSEFANEEDDSDPDAREEYLGSLSSDDLIDEFIEIFRVDDPENIRINPEWLSSNLINALGLRELVDASNLEEARRKELWRKVKELSLTSPATGEYKDLALLVGLVKTDIARVRVQFDEIESLLKTWAEA